MLNNRAKNLSPSPTMAIDGRAKKLIAEGVDVINLSVGEPDFDTPETAKAGGRAAIDQGFTKYTAAAGIVELREAIADKLRRENGLDYTADEIVVSNGAKHSLFNIFMVLLDPGDEVIIQAPYWVSYPEMVKISGGTPVIIKTDASTEFELTPEMIERALTKKTKAINLNNPSNPTGVVYSPDKLRAIADIAVRHNLVIISDEIYERLSYDGKEVVCMATLGPQVRERTVTVNGFSKAYAMTGWRLGYTASPKPLAKAMTELQSHSTSGPSSITQKAALAGLKGDRSFINTMREEFDKRRRFAVERLRSMPGFELEVIPSGAFYVFPNITKLLGQTIGGRKIETTDELCLAILDEARVAIVPGSSFGSPEHVRISYATSMEKLREGLDRIERMVASNVVATAL
ncbi:MAG TPA: pyridoxal phosphate-dependent aminotransferase [Candidatus Eremiobacteraceae bacterium]|nr:pyridoxal phosphate-dependent aminotransferase [Candidatus Eremiobacteraceae bacterium]